ncbi:MAG: DUF1549 domain-containing protein [Verrucomicrobiota bacterium]|nr:DUF1549 domain-containing protein [Verrucomicrobiota bacterium]|tara:strand:- start:411 stop:2075 length:1665 start_codon:yes stop_codon:yes gene_type:complete
MPSEKIAPPLWQRNLLFAVVCLAGVGAVVSNLLKSDTMAAPKHQASHYEKPVFRTTVDWVDEEFASEWKKAGLEPAERADDLTLIRRLSLGLTGTIPSLQEIRALEAQPEDERVQWWLSHLFEDRRTSDYLAERFARAYVGVENGPFLIYRRRRFVSWLADEFEANRPYDKIVSSLITAEGLWTTNPEVNFVTVTVDQNEDKKGPDEVKLAARVTRAFLGVRIDCVQCHDDHLGDEWLQKDFHQLASFFGKADMAISGIRETGKPYEFKYRRQREPLEVPTIVPFQPELLPERGRPRQRLARWVTHSENRAFARATVNRVWALMFGRPLVEPVDEIPLEETPENPYPPGLEILADDFIIHKFNLQRLIRVIAATRAFGLDSKMPAGRTPPTLEHDQHWAAFPLSRLRPEQVAGSIIQSASLTAINADSHILFQLNRSIQQGEFIKRYGDIGEDEFYIQGGTIPQRLLMMNGSLVHERIKDDLVANAASRILATAPNDAKVVEATYLAVLSRRPSAEEGDYFVHSLSQKGFLDRKAKQADLYWALINSTEFSWNH